MHRCHVQISVYSTSDDLAERANSKIAILKPCHNEPQARQCRMIVPLVNDVFQAHVFCSHGYAPATSSPLAVILWPRLTFVCYSTLIAPRVREQVSQIQAELSGSHGQVSQRGCHVLGCCGALCCRKESTVLELSALLQKTLSFDCAGL